MNPADQPMRCELFHDVLARDVLIERSGQHRSGLFTRDMQPKPAFHEINNLINKEWKTRLTLTADKDGTIRFRGFKGRYRVSYRDTTGKDHTRYIRLSDKGISP